MTGITPAGRAAEAMPPGSLYFGGVKNSWRYCLLSAAAPHLSLHFCSSKMSDDGKREPIAAHICAAAYRSASFRRAAYRRRLLRYFSSTMPRPGAPVEAGP